MPRKRKPVRGLWEREPGSEIWWIRYRVDGVLKREKVGSRLAQRHIVTNPMSVSALTILRHSRRDRSVHIPTNRPVRLLQVAVA